MDPEDITTLDDDALATLLEELVGSYREIRESADARSRIAELEELKGRIDAVKAESTRRSEEAAAADARLAELDAEVNGADETEGEESDDEGEQEAEPVEPPSAEAIAASAKPAAKPRATTPTAAAIAARRPAGLAPQPDPVERPHVVITAAADIPEHPMASEMTPDEMVHAIHQRWTTIRNARSLGGFEKVPVARIRTPYPEAQQLGRDPVANYATVRELARPEEVLSRWRARRKEFYAQGRDEGPRALVAAGGICDPLAARYNVDTIGSTDRAVADGMLRLDASRGGLRFVRIPSITNASAVAAVGSVTSDQDAADATKPASFFECLDEQEVTVRAVYRHSKFGNFMDRFQPETVRGYTDLTMVVQARVAESLLLDDLSANATANTTATATYGALPTILRRLAQAAAGIRSRNRLARDYPVRVVLPYWIPDVMYADLALRDSAGTDEFGATDTALMNWVERANLVPSWYMDSATGDNQVFPAQGDGLLHDFPDHAIMHLYPEGAWGFLDAGTLDVGVVRDEANNTTNTFTVFAESFEAAAFLGPESIEVDLTLCASGATAPRADDLVNCLTGS